MPNLGEFKFMDQVVCRTVELWKIKAFALFRSCDVSIKSQLFTFNEKNLFLRLSEQNCHL